MKFVYDAGIFFWGQMMQGFEIQKKQLMVRPELTFKWEIVSGNTKPIGLDPNRRKTKWTVYKWAWI